MREVQRKAISRIRALLAVYRRLSCALRDPLSRLQGVRRKGQLHLAVGCDGLVLPVALLDLRPVLRNQIQRHPVPGKDAQLVKEGGQAPQERKLIDQQQNAPFTSPTPATARVGHLLGEPLRELM